MTAEFDVIVYGTVCLDLIWRVDQLAEPGHYEPIREERRMIGGEAGNTAMALHHWGLRVALVGTAMGDDDDGQLLRGMFTEEAPAIDISHVKTIPGLQTAYCACIATPDGHRTMYGRGFTDMQCPVLDPDMAAGARCFTMDPNAYQAGLIACQVAARAGAEIIAMDYTASPEINRLSAISVSSHAQVPRGEPERTLAEYAVGIRDRDTCTTIITCGDRGCYVAEQGRMGQPAVHVPAYPLPQVIDSTGAGDIFRAGLIYGRLQGWDLLQTARFASAAAAMNCTQMGGWGGVGSLAEIAEFQRSASPKS